MQPASLLANISLSLATLFFLSMVWSMHIKSGPRGGDAVVGFAYMVFFLNLLFFACVAVAVFAIAWMGGFYWVSDKGSMRFILVAFGLLAVCFAFGLGNSGPGGMPRFLYPVAFLPAFVIPLAAIAAGFLLANDPLTDRMPSGAARLLTQAVFWSSAAIVGVFVGALLLQNLRHTFSRLTRDKNQLDSFEEGILTQIDACDISKDMVFMLVHTDANRKPAIRERALAKIKTRPDWQEELIRRLDSGWAEESFTFLASNEVDDKTLFPEAIRKGILSQAEIVRESIQGSRDFYADKYSWEIQRLLRTVEKFEGMGVDYLPAMRKLRAAFNTSRRSGNPPYKCSLILDKWIAKRQ